MNTNSNPLSDTNTVIDIGICDKPYDMLSGDDAFTIELDNGLFVSIFDAAGHGSQAHKIAMSARDILESNHNQELTSLMKTLHEGLRGTNGGVGIIGKLDKACLKMSYVGIGNIFMSRFRQSSHNLDRFVLQEGIIGYQCRTPMEKNVQLAPGDILFLYSDGIKSRFDVDDYPDIFRDDAKTIAKNVVQRFSKSGDDSTCLVVRIP